jgi:uncharacterized protein (UPF0333 family)
MKYKSQAGFAHLAAILLIVVIFAAIGGSGYYVYHKNHEKKQQAASNSQQDSTSKQQTAAITTYDECTKATDSKIQETSPQVCLTKDGKQFTQPNTQKYLVIKEWSVKIPLGTADSGAYYKIDTDVKQPATNPTNLTVYATQSDSIVGPSGTSCKGEYVAYLLRLPANDSKWQPSTNVMDGNVSPLYSERKTIGDYRYAIATHKEYGPACWETSKTGAYKADQATSQKFEDVVDAFTADFKNIVAEQ